MKKNEIKMRDIRELQLVMNGNLIIMANTCRYADVANEQCQNNDCYNCQFGIDCHNAFYQKDKIILNYTPHDVNVVNSEEKVIITYESVGEARCEQETTVIGYINNIPITETSFGEVYGLPEPKENTFYIVSRLVRQALPDREDLLVPNDVVRDATNKTIIGCKSLASN